MLPRLLYVGDVPVESSYHGSAMLYRLLSGYPADKLTVIETATPSAPERRLPGVKYLSQPIGRPRWLNTRLHPHAVAWFSRAASKMGPQIGSLLNGFQSERILTVAHGFGWLAAADLAAKRGLPLHLMVHDDWPRVAHVRPRFRAWIDTQFANVYRQAQSRICVSPAMCSSYLARYGEAAEVLYPIRAATCPEFEDAPERLKQNNGPFTVAFAGSINSNGYVQALLALQEALARAKGRLLIFGPLTSDAAQQVGLAHPNTIVCGLLSARELMTRLREDADALFVPMSFDPADSVNMAMAFPSKLADCTATGLPLLIYGPPYCSAVRWARENRGVAEVVTTDLNGDLVEAVESLAKDPPRRVVLGRRALEIGRQYFAHESVQAVFNRALGLN